MAYLVLARKWRPKGFDAITGQEHVTRTLRNAIAQNRVHHAFMFCGARGVGKTSAARVLAKALNCQAFDGPTANACGECPACREISAGTSVDVFEIDGASNRGIGEIRELRDGVAYAPQRDRFKIYIIDEVHMLTTEAFNALLKTLEEPPPHVKFIFATTEPHKIPVTILSRCQRFDFKRIPMPVMVQRLQEILQAEGIHIDDAGLRLVARESEGSMRDALSLLDRVISACGAEASYEAVAGVLGVADRAWLNRLVMAALERDAAAGLGLIAEVFEYGVDLRKFTADLVHHLRDLAMIQVAGDKAPTELSPDEHRVLKDLGARFAPEDVQRLVRMAAETAERLVTASFPRLEIEMLVIRLCRLHPVQPLDALLQRLTAIERRLASGEPLPPRVEGGAYPKADAQAEHLGTKAPPVSRIPAPAGPQSLSPVIGGPSNPGAPRPSEVAAMPAAMSTPTAQNNDRHGAGHTESMAAPSKPLPDPVSHTIATPSIRAVAQTIAGPPGQPVASPPATAPIMGTPAIVATVAEPVPGALHRASATSVVTPTSPARVVPEPPPNTAPRTIELAPIIDGPVTGDGWERIVETLRIPNPLLAGALDHTAVGHFEAGTLTLDVAGDVTERRLGAKLVELQQLVARLAPAVATITLRHVPAVPDSPHQRRVLREARLRADMRSEIETHPLVLALQQRLGGVLGEIELNVPSGPSGPSERKKA